MARGTEVVFARHTAMEIGVDTRGSARIVGFLKLEPPKSNRNPLNRETTLIETEPSQCVRNMYMQNPDITSRTTPISLQPDTGIHENPVLGKPGTSVFSLLTALGFITE